MSKIEDYTPPAVQQFVDWMAKETGVTPTVERAVHKFGSIWTATHANERVTYVRIFRSRGGRIEMDQNLLYLDGERVPLRDSSEAYFALFNDVDEKPKAKKKAEAPEVVPLEEDWRPALVDSSYRTISKRVSDTIVGMVRDRYVIQGRGPGGVFQVYFAKVGQRWEVDPVEGILFISPDGDDLTWEAGGDLMKAIALLMMGSGESPTADQYTPVGRPKQTPARATSVQVRNTAVIRN